jgi:hypothetical protein
MYNTQKINNMKKMVFLCAILMAVSVVNAQSTLMLADGSTVSGQVKATGLRSGKIVVIADNKRSTYEAGNIKEATIDGNRYVSHKNDLFLEVVKGEKLSLYQKQSFSGGKINYNGAEPVLIPASEGSIGDYFLSADGGTTMQLTSKKRFAEDIRKSCSNCNAVVADIEGGRLGFADIKQIVQNLNKL